MSHVEEGQGGLHKAPTKEERKQMLRGEKEGERDQIKVIDLRFEKWQVVGFRKARRRQIDVSWPEMS